MTTPATPVERDLMQVARELAERFARTAVERDRRGGTPKQERDDLRASGLLAAAIPRELGGWGASFAVVLRAVRTLAAADGSVAHVFGFQHLLLATVRLFGAPRQWQEAYSETARHNLFWGNALNPLDKGVRLLNERGRWVLRGRKSFCSGALDSDRLVVSALREPDGKFLVGVIPTARAGLHALADWDNMGQRQTDSGSVDFADVELDEAELLTTPGPLSTPFAALRPCIAQLILANVYLGVAEGAFAEARGYALERRAWAASGVELARFDPYVLHQAGSLWLELEAGRLLVEHAAEGLDAAWQRGEALTAEQRGATAVRIAAAKVSSTRVSLEVTSRMFELMGARATTARLAMDRFFRNVRTHTLHDPVDYKLKELGDFALNDAFPTPSFYS